MRTFDYGRLPQRFVGDVSAAIAQLHEDRGKLEMLKSLSPEELEALSAKARFDNIEASAHIEGLYAQEGRLQELLAGETPADEVEAQLMGYAQALSLIESDFGTLPLSTATILTLFETMYGHRDLGRKSRYRKKDYAYVQVDGHMEAMPVSPITAFETPLVLGGACDALAEAFAAGSASPLVLSAVFAVDFLCIRPFDEGNGRIARLFSRLILDKAGFDIARYVSADRIIEERAMAYYDALNACVEGWDRGFNDYRAYVAYWLDTLHDAYQSLFSELERVPRSKLGKTERVRRYVQEVGSPVAKRQIRVALPDVSEATVEAALGAMVKEGVAEKIGAGRSTAYRWIGKCATSQAHIGSPACGQQAPDTPKAP